MGIRLLLIFICFTPHHLTAEFRVGAILPLSGAAADYGQGISNGIELALDDQPGCRKILRFIYEDAQHDPMQAVRAYNKLRTQNKVDLMYTFGVSFCKALAPLAELNRLPTIGQCIDPAASRGRSYFMRFQNSTDEYMKTQLNHLAGGKAKRIALVIAEHSYVEALEEAIDRNLGSAQIIILRERLPTTELDFRSTILKLKRAKPDAVGLLLLNGQHGAFGRQARELRLETPLFGTNVLEGLSELESAGNALDGTTLVGHPISPFFSARYSATFGKLTQASFSALAYEFATSLCIAAKSGDAKDILSALQSTPIAGKATGPCQWVNSPSAGRYVNCALEVRRIYGAELRRSGEVEAKPPNR
jgi:branched-chain amino acid transport system substrate-binding protein